MTILGEELIETEGVRDLPLPPLEQGPMKHHYLHQCPNNKSFRGMSYMPMNLIISG